MTVSYTLLGETPSKKNSRIFVQRIGRLLPSKQFTAWHKDALEQLKFQGARPVPCECHIKLVFRHGDLRRRDSDNGTSSILDLLVDAGILPDDNWRVVRTLYVCNEYVPKDARCFITITSDFAETFALRPTL